MEDDNNRQDMSPYEILMLGVIKHYHNVAVIDNTKTEWANEMELLYTFIVDTPQKNKDTARANLRNTLNSLVSAKLITWKRENGITYFKYIEPCTTMNTTNTGQTQNTKREDSSN